MQRAKPVGYALAAIASVVGVLVVLRVAADWLAATDGIRDPVARAEEIGRARTAVLAVLAGGLAAIGAYYTHRSFGLSRQGQITERFTRAVDQIGNRDSRDVRLGGIYALERLARESRDDHGPIVEILTAYVREHTPIPPEDVEEELVQANPDTYPEPPTADVQAALTVLGRRNTANDPPLPWRLDLSGAYLPKADLDGANFAQADLSYAVLDLARLEDAQLSQAILRNARLAYTKMHSANLEHADLSRVRAFQTQLNRARLAHASLDHAFLHGADLREAQLQHSDLDDSHLVSADLSGADLTGARFVNARYSTRTAWPQGFDAEASGASRAADS